MSDVPDSLAHYLAAWNEPDPTRIRAHLERAVVDKVLFVDPANTTRDIAALEAMMADARKERPGASYHLASGIDGHNGRFRYLWEVRIDGERLLPGMDVTQVDADGFITQIDGFFGDFPALGS